MRTKISALMRAAAVVTGTVGIVSGVTFASLQSQAAVLKGNSIQTANAGLQVSTDGTTYASSVPGYGIGGLVPGGMPMPSNGGLVYVKNTGTAAEAVSLSIPSGFTNTDNLDLTKVHVVLSPIGAGAGQNVVLQDLIDAGVAGIPLTVGNATHLFAGNTTGFTIKFSLDSDAIVTTGATVNNLDFDLIGTAVS
jgi:hypothetical protein